MSYIKFVLFASVFITLSNLNAQITRRVLFLGNSYTSVNNLPQIVYDAALSAGDNLIFDGNTPGGYRLIDHSANAVSQNKIMTGGWNYVVVQGQSQEPITFNNQFTTGGGTLYNQIKQYNSCAVVMPYMTWGRKNGDQSNCAAFPVMCTYKRMDSTLKERYLTFASLVKGEVSPVSVVWNYLRQNYPSIDLYQTDESHPSPAGSYAAACCFYTCIFKKDPTLITYNLGLNSSDASVIRNAVKTQVYNNLQLWDYKKLPVSNFSYQIGTGTNQVIFSPLSMGASQTYLWNFGDGTTSTATNPSHSYLNNGTYTVSLTTTNCNVQGLHTSFKDTVLQFCSHTPTVYTSKAWLCNYDTLWTQTANSYQWYYGGVPLPETNQYLANYARYNISGFSVISTVNVCSELSKTFTETPVYSGYYFDIKGFGNPCVGDTVAFVVLHISGSLSGTEKILWFKDGIALTQKTNKDTLHMSSSGKYECKIIDPNSNCPFDTTSYHVKFDCGSTVGIEKRIQELSWDVFPNPASEKITIKSTNPGIKEQAKIYNATGHLIKIIEVMGAATLSVADFPNGLYFIRLKDDKQPPVKFIKQ